MHPSSALLRAALLGLCVFLPTAAFAGPKPSFNCAKAESIAEKAICKNAGLAASDLQVADDYARLKAALDPQSAAALADDQRWFVGARDGRAEAEGGASAKEIGATLKERTKFLEAVDPRPAEPFIGSWHNEGGGIDISKAADGSLKVAANTAHPVDGRWVCEFKGTGKLSDDVLAVKQDADEGDKASGAGLTLTRVGASLKVDFVPAPEADDQTEDFCGNNGSVTGSYFSVPAGYGD